MIKIKKGSWGTLALITLFLASIMAKGQELTGEEILERIRGEVTLAGGGMATVRQSHYGK